MPDVDVKDLTKRFKDNLVLDQISFTARDGELLTLLGPSGCGKSTTLWSIAGLHKPDGGSVTVGDTTYFDQRTNLLPEQRRCGVVFQSYAIWPHMNVEDNVTYPLKTHKYPASKRRARAQEVLDLVDIGHLAARYPHELSGGQQQRVALARALAYPPALLLLDEPFSNLDAKLRDRARDWVRTLQREIGVTTVFVTHDQSEALSMSDRVVVMNGGRIQQIGGPEDIYHRPANRFVAEFVGLSNLISATADSDMSVHVAGLSQTLRTEGSTTNGAVTVAIRPESVRVHCETPPVGLPNSMRLPVRDVVFLGDHYRYVLAFGGTSLIARHQDRIDSCELDIDIPPHKIVVVSDSTT